MPEQDEKKKPDSRALFGRTAVAMGLVTPQQVADCLDLQRRLSREGGSIPLGKIMLAKGYMTAFQIGEVLKAQGAHAVRCISCGAEFAVGRASDPHLESQSAPDGKARDGTGPIRCPRCLRRLSDFFPAKGPPPGPGRREAAEGLPARPEVTQEIAAVPSPPGPGSALRVEPREGAPCDVDVLPGGTIAIGRLPSMSGPTDRGSVVEELGAADEAPRGEAADAAAADAEGGLVAGAAPGVAGAAFQTAGLQRAGIQQRTVGVRDLEKRVLIADGALSRRHCVISNEGGRLAVEDMGSRNGTFVNGERVGGMGKRKRRLKPGDEIEIGESRILVRSPRGHAPTPRNTTDIWRAEGLCMLCGMVIPAEDLEAGKAQRAREGLLCQRCLEVALVPGRTLGGYRILEQIGIGGMAEVYRAEQVSSGRLVALKSLLNPQGASEACRQRFVQEARAGARLEHPNLVRIYDTGEESGIPYIVMELVEGEDLADILDRRGSLDVASSVDIALDIASALAYAHSHNVIHRDVKPANILIDTVFGRSRLLDLGVAKIHDLDDHARLTRTGIGLGTLEYAAPEQIESAKHVDGRADIYSLGATLYRCVVGKRPFAAGREFDLARAIMYDPVKWPDEAKRSTPRSLRKAVGRAMAKRPARRYRTADDFRAALAKVREGLD